MGAAARPGFAVDQATLGPVLRICRALDGMPLAIELAAARLHALSPDQVAARLDDRFRLLADGRRPGAGRHQTLRAVIDWSWELLGPAEQVLLRRLSVFAGGATLEAVERVCAGPDPGGLAADEALYLLAGLVDKSLVVADEDAGGGDRYRMLETVRAYGAERRRAAGEDEPLARAHAGYFLALAERAEPELRRRDQLRWLGRLAADRDNLHAALRSAVDGQEAAVALRLATERPPAALVLRSPFASLAEVGQLHYPLVPVSLLLRDRYDSAALAGRLAAPLLVVAGGRDRIVPASHSRRLFAAAPQPKRLVVLEGADHNDLDLLAGPRLLEELRAFLAGVPGLRG